MKRKSFWLSFRQVIGGTTLVVSKDNLDFELEESHDIEVSVKKNSHSGHDDKGIQCIQLFFSQTLFDFKRLVSHSISPKFSGKIPYVLSKPRICFLGSKDKTVLF